MVIMDKQQYTDKVTALLNDTNTYRTIPQDPTRKLKNKLIGILKDIKQDVRTQPTARFTLLVQPPKFYGLFKIHKVGTPLRPIFSSRGSITYGMAKELVGIICPLVG